MASFECAPVSLLIAPSVLASFHLLERSSQNIYIQVNSIVSDGLLLSLKRAQKTFSALWFGPVQAAQFQDVSHLSDNCLLPSCVSGTTVGAKSQQRQMEAIFTRGMLGVPHEVFETKLTQL